MACDFPAVVKSYVDAKLFTLHLLLPCAISEIQAKRDIGLKITIFTTPAFGAPISPRSLALETQSLSRSVISMILRLEQTPTCDIRTDKHEATTHTALS